MAIYLTDIESLLRDCDLFFVRDSGPGGQHRNKRETGVRLVHRATGITVTATERRSQAQNRTLAYERMAKKLADAQKQPRRRRPTRPTRGSINRRLTAKGRQAEKKAGRSKPVED